MLCEKVQTKMTHLQNCFLHMFLYGFLGPGKPWNIVIYSFFQYLFKEKLHFESAKVLWNGLKKNYLFFDIFVLDSSHMAGKFMVKMVLVIQNVILFRIKVTYILYCYKRFLFQF